MIGNMLDLERMIKKLNEQKRKYHAKVLSSDALYANWLRGMDIEGFMPWYVWLLIPEFTYTGIAYSILFDIPPSDIVPVNWDFNVELPDIDELLQGILADIYKIDWSTIYKWLSDIEKLIKETVEEEFQQQMLESRPRKAVYGRTRYNRSYLDPPAVREAIRSTLHKLWIERYTLKQLRDDHEKMAEILKLAEGFKQLLFNKISQVVFAQPSAMILGYGVLGRSYLGRKVRPEPEPEAELKMINYSLELIDWYGNTLDHAKVGLVLGIIPLGYGYLMPPRTVFKKPLPPKQLQPLTDFVRRRGTHQVHTVSWNPFTVGNYNKPEEQLDWRKSERADQWMNLQLVRYQIERIVDPIIRRYESNPVKIRMYKSAVLQLVTMPIKRHRWGYEAFKAMGEEEFVNWWIEHWKSQGLKEEVLRQLYERLKRWMPEWRKYMYKLGIRVKEARYRLAHLK